MNSNSKFSKVFIFAMSAILSLTAFNSAGAATKTSGKAGQILRMQQGLDLLTFDPPNESALFGIAVAHNTYESILKYDFATSSVVPSLVSKWTVDDDGTTYTFTMDSKAKFMSGNKVRSQDVKWSWERVLTWPTAIQGASLNIIRAAKIEAPDANTLVVTLPSPASSFLNLTTGAAWSVLDQLKVEQEAGLTPEAQRAWLKNNQATSAKYYIDKYVPLSFITLKRNEKYWGKVKAVHPSIEIKMVTESSQQVNAMKKGDADVIFDAQLQALADLKKAKKKILGGFDSQTYYLGLNMKEAPFNNADVREAVRYAIDYDGIVKGLLSGYASKAGGILGKGFMGFDQSLDTKYTLDIAKAKALLTKAGFPNGFETTIHLNTGPTKNLGVQNEVVMTKIQADLAKVGIKVQLIVMDVATLFPIYRACQDGPCAIRGIYWSFGSVVPDVDPLASAHGDWNTLGTRRLWDKQNDYATSALGRARFVTNVTERNNLYKSVGQAVSGKAGPYVFLFRPNGLAVTGADVKTLRWVPFWVFEAD